RARRNKVFAKVAGWGKSSVDWFYGLKLHIIVNDQGELLAFAISPGNTDDRKPVESMTHEIFGKLFGDRGYISKKLAKNLHEKMIQLFTTVRKNMRNRLINITDKILLRKRTIIETINDQLKNISQIEHTRHRSPVNCLVNVLAGLAAYCFQSKKPSLNINKQERLPILF
ncbi:MAG: IS982 family transposase, partial [Proteobacteria bacterium]|nr:IS982 family transposase [Pseudomonadota bacterium]